MRRLVALSGTLLLTASLVVPLPALAHGLSVRQDIPVPLWLVGWGAALVLMLSFVALAALWPSPQLQAQQWRQLPGWFSRVFANRLVEILCGAVGVLLFAVVIYSGLAGTASISQNFAPTFVYIVFWLLPLPLSVLFGDVFRAFNPWRAIARTVAFVGTEAVGTQLPAPLEYPHRLGRWPAVLGILAFVWLELAAPDGAQPKTVAVAALIYSTCTFVGMALYGVEPWVSRAEAFGSYFNLVSRIAIFERRGARIGLRPPLSGLPAWEPLPGSVAFIAALIGTVSFDGFSAGPTWNSSSFVVEFVDLLKSLGVSQARSFELVFGLGIVATVGTVIGFYRLGIAGARGVGGGFSSRELSRTFAHSLAPIAFAYASAHYVSFLLLQGQAIVALASDPLGQGDNLFGTADRVVNYALIGSSTIWYIQVGLVIAGHVGGLVLAHDRAIAIYDDPRTATRSQYWMLGVMVGFTSLALWLLSESSKG